MLSFLWQCAWLHVGDLILLVAALSQLHWLIRQEEDGGKSELILSVPVAYTILVVPTFSMKILHLTGKDYLSVAMSMDP